MVVKSFMVLKEGLVVVVVVVVVRDAVRLSGSREERVVVVVVRDSGRGGSG
jgi:hypothetical protein